MQIDGYSLDAQKSRMKAYAEFNDFQIVGEYEDAGKSGKSIEGRLEFNRMMEDIKSGKDGVSYVLVFKLSRFGRNAADVLSTLQVMQDFGVNLICVEDGIDSSKDAGKLMISVLSAVAEIERENIRVQTMEGRIQKAREGKWNGGFAPYGYTLEKGKLFVNKEEAEAIRIIFDQYVHTDMGANGVARYLANHGIGKIQRQNGKNPLFDAALIRRILKNPVYCGKIAYGRRRTEKVHGTRNDYRLVEQDNYLLVDGQHEAIVSEELWNDAQVKLLAQAKRYEKVNHGKDNKVHLLTGLLKCPICGAGMYGNKSVKHKADGSKYKDFFYYGCKHRTMTRGHKCDYKKQINEELLDAAVAEVITKLVSNPKFASLMQQKISMKVDTTAIEQEIANYEKQLRQSYSIKTKLIEEIDTLDPDDKHYIKRKADLDDRLYKMYDKIEDTETLLIEARAKKTAIEAEKLTADNIYKVLIYFDKLYAVMDEQERRQLMESLISEVHIYEERQPNGQWLKSIKFKLPIIEEDMEMSLDNDTQVESVFIIVQNIRKSRRRPTKMGDMGIFSGLLYCAECGGKMYQCRATNFTEEQKYFICSTYRKGKDLCTTHSIRNVVLHEIVLKNLREAIQYVSQHEAEFMQEAADISMRDRDAEFARKRDALAKADKRIAELDRIISRLYEDNVMGKLSDDRFIKMSHDYELEQSNLKSMAEVLRKELKQQEQQKTNAKAFVAAVKKYTDMQELDAAVLREFIDRIEVSHADKKSKTREITIVYNFIGAFDFTRAIEEAHNTTQKQQKTA